MIIENLVVKYSGRSILKPSTLRVATTGVTALLGRNGTGKSSVFNSVYGLYPAKDLIISFAGTKIDRPYLTRGLINYLSQNQCHPGHFNLRDLCEHYAVDAREFITSYPLFRDLADHPLSKLSYGLRRLLSVLILIHAPVKFTILDEPFSSIMPIHHDLIVAAIHSCRHRKGILLSDHQYRTVLSVTDRLYLIHEQSIIKINDPAELISYHYVTEGSDLPERL